MLLAAALRSPSVRTNRWAPQVCGNPRRPRNARQYLDVIKWACREIVGLAPGVLSAADDRGRHLYSTARGPRRDTAAGPRLFPAGAPGFEPGTSSPPD